jgi:hypothetical protein
MSKSKSKSKSNTVGECGIKSFDCGTKNHKTKTKSNPKGKSQRQNQNELGSLTSKMTWSPGFNVKIKTGWDSKSNGPGPKSNAVQ